MSLFHIYMPHRRRIIGCTMMSKVFKRSVLCLESRYDMKVAFYRIFCMWCIWSLYIVDICMCNILCVGLFFVIPLVRFWWTAVDCRFAEIERSLLQTSCRVWDKNGSPFFPRRERINHRCLAFNSKVLDEKETVGRWRQHASGKVSCLRALDSLDTAWFGCICSCIIPSFKKQSRIERFAIH